MALRGLSRPPRSSNVTRHHRRNSRCGRHHRRNSRYDSASTGETSSGQPSVVDGPRAPLPAAASAPPPAAAPAPPPAATGTLAPSRPALSAFSLMLPAKRAAPSRSATSDGPGPLAPLRAPPKSFLLLDFPVGLGQASGACGAVGERRCDTAAVEEVEPGETEIRGTTTTIQAPIDLCSPLQLEPPPSIPQDTCQCGPVGPVPLGKYGASWRQTGPCAFPMQCPSQVTLQRLSGLFCYHRLRGLATSA